MTTEEQEDIAAAVSEPAQVEQPEHKEEPQMVPLSAMMGEKKRRQEETRLRYEAEARTKVLEEMMSAKNNPEVKEDPEALLTKGSFQEEKALTKREILEQVYEDMNPVAVQEINQFLKPILDKKPWLAASVDSALNRLARAKEIVDDYRHLVDDKPKSRSNPAVDAQRIVQNAQKPGSPVAIGKSAQPTGMEYLKSIQGKKEFREYRQKILQGG